MAHLNRDFLVPYLQDVCAVELMIEKLTSEKEKAQNRIQKIKSDNTCPRPCRRTPKVDGWDAEQVGGMFGLGFVGMIIGIVLSLIFKWYRSPWSLLAVLGPYPLVFFLTIWSHHSERIAAEEWCDEDFRQQEAEYANSMLALEKARPEIKRLESRIAALKIDLDKAKRLRTKLYNVNVIPDGYRNIYAAVFLYRYFSTSRADDIDAVLQTLILEEIKAKLDQIISMQSEIILNQERMIANQRASLESQRKHQAYMENKARQIASSIEEQNIYMEMTAANTAATAYFAAANYFSNL
ncbi:MAG: hypothetical protein ACI4V3_07580 [Faecousia sp.]